MLFVWFSLLDPIVINVILLISTMYFINDGIMDNNLKHIKSLELIKRIAMKNKPWKILGANIHRWANFP